MFFFPADNIEIFFVLPIPFRRGRAQFQSCITFRDDLLPWRLRGNGRNGMVCYPDKHTLQQRRRCGQVTLLEIFVFYLWLGESGSSRGQSSLVVGVGSLLLGMQFDGRIIFFLWTFLLTWQVLHSDVRIHSSRSSCLPRFCYIFAQFMHQKQRSSLGCCCL